MISFNVIVACGRINGNLQNSNNGTGETATNRMKRRKKSCAFTQSTLLQHEHEDAVSALVCIGDWLITGKL